MVDEHRAEEVSSNTYFERAQLKWASSDYEGVIADCTEALKLDSQFAEAYSRRASAHYMLGEYEKALKDADEAVGANLNYPLAYNNRGIARYALGDVEGALDDYHTSLRLDPDFLIAYTNLLKAYQKIGNVDGQIAAYSELIRINRNDTSAYGKRAVLLHEQDNVDGAIADYTAIIRLNGEHIAIAYHNRGSAYLDKRDYQQAFRDYTEALQLNPRLTSSCRGLADCYFEQKRFRQALEMYEQYLQAGGDDAREFVLQRIEEIKQMMWQ